MGVYSDITFNGVALNVTSCTPTKAQKTRKNVIGKTLAQANIIGMDASQWELEINGIVTGTTSTNLSTNRAAIEALDVVAPYAFVDGIHNGTYYLVPGTLEFQDSSDRGNTSYIYSFSLVEE